MTFFLNFFNQTSYSKSYIHRIMKIVGVKSRIRKARYIYTKIKPEEISENILNREFTSSFPNEKWLTDITEFKVPLSNKKIYLSAILDLYDKSIVAYKISRFNNNQLVFDTFNEAIKLNPNVKPLFHSDRGFQYTSRVFKTKLDKANMTQSMSRVGKCIDNGPMEGFWGTIKSEMYYGCTFKNEEELISKIKEYIWYYNNGRPQEKLGTTPALYRCNSQKL